MGTRGIGVIGEQMAVRHLEAAGMVVLDRNWRCAEGGLRGEIDIVARDGDVLVFCEVKARRGEAAGHPLEAITPRKVAQLRRLAGAWLAAAEGGRRRAAEPGAAGAGRGPRPVRLDAVGVCWPAAGGRAHITHVRAIG
jgi:putative endonuclease